MIYKEITIEEEESVKKASDDDEVLLTSSRKSHKDNSIDAVMNRMGRF